jgi:hypothetical protein
VRGDEIKETAAEAAVRAVNLILIEVGFFRDKDGVLAEVPDDE